MGIVYVLSFPIVVWNVCLQNKLLRVGSPPVRFAPDVDASMIFLLCHSHVKHVCLRTCLAKFKVNQCTFFAYFLKITGTIDAKIMMMIIIKLKIIDLENKNQAA